MLGAFERALRPLMRLALAFGVKHAQLEEVLRNVLLDEARRAWREKGTEPNISQLSVTTGLNRKAVTSHVREQAASLPQTETARNIAADVRAGSAEFVAQHTSPTSHRIGHRRSRKAPGSQSPRPL